MTAAASSRKQTCRFLMKFFLRRNRPAALTFFGASFLCFPLQYMLKVFVRQPSPDGTLSLYLSGPAHIHTEISLVAVFGMMLTLPVLLTLAQVYWLHSQPAVDLFHGLPVSRDSLLLASAGAVFATVALPVTADYLIILLAGGLRLAVGLPENAVGFTLPVGQILLDYLGWMSTVLALIAVTLVVATQVGSIFENFVFTVELLLGPLACLFLSVGVCSAYLPGYTSGMVGDEYLWISPVTIMFARYLEYDSWVDPPVWLQSNWIIFFWLGMSAVLLWAACRLYRRRPSELAGTTGAREPLNTLGRLALVYIGGLGLALLLYRTSFSEQDLPFWAAVLLCSGLVAAVCQLLMGRGIRGMKKRLPAMAAAVAATTLFAFVVTHGGLGYTTYLPDPDRVGSATISYRGRYGELAKRIRAADPYIDKAGEYHFYQVGGATFTTPQGIRLVEAFHRHLAEIPPDGNEVYCSGMFFRYGDGTSRAYAGLGPNYLDPSFYRDIATLLAIEESLEFRQQTDPRFTVTPEEVTAIRASDLTGLRTAAPILDREQIAALLAAMKEDAEIFDPTVLREGGLKALAYLTVETPVPRDYKRTAPLERDCWQTFCLPVYPTDRRTREVMEELGLGEMLAEPDTGGVAALRISYGGNHRMKREVYWTGTGPQDLMPTRSSTLELENKALEGYFGGGTYILWDQGEIQRVLADCLGVDCVVWEEGYTVTLEGEDRTGCTFWLPADRVPQAVWDWFTENGGERFMTKRQ